MPMLLQPQDRNKLDPSDDSQFYAFPRFVTHVDEGFIDRLGKLYRDRIRPHSRVLDLMSSWVSHLPEDVPYTEVVGHGMNREELAKNRQLSSYFIQDLNINPQLPLEDASFDAVLIAVSVQYLQYPEKVFAEIRRVLASGGVAIVSFSNRMFYQKAISAWRDADDRERLELVKQYFQNAGGFTTPQAIAEPSATPNLLFYLGLFQGDPFYATLAYRK